MSLSESFIWLDVSLALGALAWLLIRRLRGTLAQTTWWQFWLGFWLGMSWELAFFLVGPAFSADPPYRLAVSFPFHPAAQPILHSLWDAALFLVGAALVRKLCRPPHFARPRLAELGVLIAWGQAQELCVELLASGSGTWTFIPRPWNPALFTWGVGHVTLVPQLIWLIAPILFYAGAIWIEGISRRQAPLGRFR